MNDEYLVVTVKVNLTKFGNLADTELDRTKMPEFIQDGAIAATKTGLKKFAPYVDDMIEGRFGEYAEVDVKVA